MDFLADTNLMKHDCRVCGEPAAGYHFGAFTCEGCKSFFGRYSDNKRLPSFQPCKSRTNHCDVNGRNRTVCKRCRYHKCLEVGMGRANSRYGRRSHYFKMACLMEAADGSSGTPSPSSVRSRSISEGSDGSGRSLPAPDVHKPLALLPPLSFSQMELSNLGLCPYPLTYWWPPVPPQSKEPDNHVSVIRVLSQEQKEPLDLSLKSESGRPLDLSRPKKQVPL